MMEPAPPQTVAMSSDPPAAPADLLSLMVGQPGLEAGSGMLIGTVLDDRHPQRPGRVLVRMPTPSGVLDLWLPCLAHLAVRRDDRVLLLRPGNWPEALVAGVVDGLSTARPEPRPAALIELRADEALEVRGQDGRSLLSIVPGSAGPVIRLARSDQRVEVAGHLEFAAESITLRASGAVGVQAGGDVEVVGEAIRLN